MKVPFKTDLTGKTAIVTGGSGTLCSAIAYGLAVSGAKIALIGRRLDKLQEVTGDMTAKAEREYGKKVIVKGYSCDVTDKIGLVQVYEIIKRELGSCDILINGAGGNQPGAITSIEALEKEKGVDDYSFWNLDEDRIRDVMNLNYMGTLLPIQVFTKDMVEKRSGSIINIASVTSILPLTKVIAYGNAKSAILNLTQWLAVHLGESGIRCNAIAPGFYAAEQNHKLLYNEERSFTKRAKKIIAGTPMRKFGNPEDLIGAALFLADDEASAFVNGIVLQVDGGYCAYSGV